MGRREKEHHSNMIQFWTYTKLLGVKLVAPQSAMHLECWVSESQTHACLAQLHQCKSLLHDSEWCITSRWKVRLLGMKPSSNVLPPDEAPYHLTSSMSRGTQVDLLHIASKELFWRLKPQPQARSRLPSITIAPAAWSHIFSLYPSGGKRM